MGLRRLLRSWERRRLFGMLAPAIIQRSTSQLQQDLWVLAETKCKRGGFFVEIGAFDGVNHSNTYLLEKEFGWEGILVEPNPDCFDSLRKNRSALISTNAIHSRTCVVEFAQVKGKPALSTLAEHRDADRHAAFRRANCRVISVEAITLDELTKRHNVRREIDYLSIDTEGSELEIISDFDFAKHRVRLLSVEHNNTSREGEVERLLIGAGFKRVFRRLSQFDAWYRRTW